MDRTSAINYKKKGNSMHRLFEPVSEYKDKQKEPCSCRTITTFILGISISVFIMYFVGVVS